MEPIKRRAIGQIEFLENTIVVNGIRIRYASICSYQPSLMANAPSVIVRACGGAVIAEGSVSSYDERKFVLEMLDKIINENKK